MKSQVTVVNAVLSGEVDVGYVRTDQIERTIDETTGELVDRSKLKIIRPLEGLSSDGKPFPFVSSTPLYPEWNLAAISQVPEEIRSAVQISLMRIGQHIEVVSPLESCFIDDGCAENSIICQDQCFQKISPEWVKNCDTTAAVAFAAQDAASAGKYAGWSSSDSYMELRNMQEQVGFYPI